MADVTFHFDVDGADFSSAGEASVKVKKKLRQLGVSPDVIRKVSIAMYEGEINMVIHAEGIYPLYKSYHASAASDIFHMRLPNAYDTDAAPRITSA